MHGRHHRNRVFGRINVRKLDCNFANAGQSVTDHRFTQMVQFQQYMVGIFTATATFLDFCRHRARYYISTCKIFGIGSIT